MVYSGSFMKNSKGFPTNALYGFANMINKIIKEENPSHIIVAFDTKTTFRHEKYKDYKKGRLETPDDLIKQFSVAKEMLTNMGIKHYEIPNYEADDIIGTFAKICDDNNYEGLIISSDKDLLQLISKNVQIKLLQKVGHILYDEKKFNEDYGITPTQYIDLKALQGDSSDNIPGVKGIGEKTGLKLIKEFKSLDNLYKNIEKIKGKRKENLITDKKTAYLSYYLSTIVKDVPLSISIEDIKYKKSNMELLNKLYEELEFYSLLKRIKQEKLTDITIVENIDDINIEGECAVYLEVLGKNYHTAEILGMGVYNENTKLFIPLDVLKENPKFLRENKKYVYDYKKTYVSLKWNDI